MKKNEVAAIKRTLLCIMAGVAALQFVREVPFMIRYFKMERL
jgi:hypothetical protein